MISLFFSEVIMLMRLKVDIHNSHPFSQSFDFASGEICKRFQNPLWQITEIFFGGPFRESIAKVKAFGAMLVQNAVQSRLNKSEDDSNSLGGISGTLINSLLDSIDDHEMVADAALNYLSAGKLPYLPSAVFLLIPDRQRYHCPSSNLGFLPPPPQSLQNGPCTKRSRDSHQSHQ